MFTTVGKRLPCVVRVHKMSRRFSGPVQMQIHQKLEKSFEPVHLEVENESYKHSVPANSETHFKVVVVSSKFSGLPLLKQHQLVNDTLREELQTGVHALSIKTSTIEKWKAAGEVIHHTSPNCLGGSKHDTKEQNL